MNPKNLTNEELASILRAMRITGCSTTPFEKECLEEIADRLDKFEIWNGVHKQIIAPKGTFEKIYNEAKENEE